MGGGLAVRLLGPLRKHLSREGIPEPRMNASEPTPTAGLRATPTPNQDRDSFPAHGSLPAYRRPGEASIPLR